MDERLHAEVSAHTLRFQYRDRALFFFFLDPSLTWFVDVPASEQASNTVFLSFFLILLLLILVLWRSPLQFLVRTKKPFVTTLNLLCMQPGTGIDFVLKCVCVYGTYFSECVSIASCVRVCVCVCVSKLIGMVTSHVVVPNRI